MKRLFSILIIVVLTISLASCSGGSGSNLSEESTGLVLATWDDRVKEGLNALMEKYGKFSKNYVRNSYAVFDFDNTCTIFDVEDQLAVYQLEHMAFAKTMDPELLGEVLASGLSDPDKKRGKDYSSNDASYNDWIRDITSAYQELYDGFGPFTPEGLTEVDMEKVQDTEAWDEFSAKMLGLYYLVFDKEEEDVAYPWVLYWFTGMTESEVYSLARASHEFYKEVESANRTLSSPKKRDSKAGIVECSITSGVSAPDNIIELMTALNNNGIKVWIASGSSVEVVKSACDVFGLHDMVTGVIAMTPKQDGGKFVNEYDYDTGLPWITDGNRWKTWNKPVKAQPHGEGKVKAVQNTIAEEYGQGPIAGFMDSSDGFNLCTEFKSMKVAVCFNRASRRVTDGGGLISELAVYQSDDLGYDFEKAEEAGDTLYLLQGRDETELRALRNSNMTIRLGYDSELLFRPVPEGQKNQNELQYQYMKDNKMTTREVIDLFAVRIPEGDPANKLGFEYGFLEKEEFPGYHSID